MAIRIIDEKPHKSVIKETICRNCGVTLEYTPADVASYVEHDYAGGSDTVRYVLCPRCSHRAAVN